MSEESKAEVKPKSEKTKFRQGLKQRLKGLRSESVRLRGIANEKSALLEELSEDAAGRPKLAKEARAMAVRAKAFEDEVASIEKTLKSVKPDPEEKVERPGDGTG